MHDEIYYMMMHVGDIVCISVLVVLLERRVMLSTVVLVV